jgi:hypothetical protein
MFAIHFRDAGTSWTRRPQSEIRITASVYGNGRASDARHARET